MSSFAVVVFPGSNCDYDCYYMLKNHFSQPCRFLWHEETDISDIDCIVLPGGFSYGDYLRTGCIASFSPIIEPIKEHADKGKPVIGICNGFQILVESKILPGAFIRNSSLTFVCKWTNVVIENTGTPFTKGLKKRDVLKMPIANGEGSYYLDEANLVSLDEYGGIVLRYSDDTGNPTEESNPNGSVDNIAGICNPEGNVLGIMPHPERSYEKPLGSSDGARIFQSVISWLEHN